MRLQERARLESERQKAEAARQEALRRAKVAEEAARRQAADEMRRRAEEARRRAKAQEEAARKEAEREARVRGEERPSASLTPACLVGPVPHTVLRRAACVRACVRQERKREEERQRILAQKRNYYARDQASKPGQADQQQRVPVVHVNAPGGRARRQWQAPLAPDPADPYGDPAPQPRRQVDLTPEQRWVAAGWMGAHRAWIRAAA